MDTHISYRYSKKNGVVTIVLMLVLGALFTSNVYRAYYGGDRFNFVLFAILLMLLALAATIVVAKRLIPAFKDKIVLEFDDEKITDHLRNITINWHDIKTIDIRRTRSATLIMLQLKWESDHGAVIPISLRWVEGKDTDIHDIMLAFFSKYSEPE